MFTGLLFLSVIVLYLSAAHSFHFCLFVCVLSILSLLHLLRERAWHKICASAVEIVLPYQESGCRTQTVAECAREMAPHWSQWLQRIMNICLLPPTHPGPVPFSLFQFMGITIFQIMFWCFLLISSTKMQQKSVSFIWWSPCLWSDDSVIVWHMVLTEYPVSVNIKLSNLKIYQSTHHSVQSSYLALLHTEQ